MPLKHTERERDSEKKVRAEREELQKILNEQVKVEKEKKKSN